MSLRVRPGREDDAALLRAIRLEALADSPDAFGDTYDECAAWSLAQWAHKAREWNFYLAEYEGRVVGMARGETHDGRPESRWLFAMYVSPSQRGSEAARALVDMVSAWASAQGVAALHLYVSTSMARARAFYDKVGFVATGSSVVSTLGDGRVFEELRRDLAAFDFRVENVAPAMLHDLRRRVLRADDPLIDVTNPGDELDATRHVGGFLGPRVVASASFFAVPAPFAPEVPAYQLRYMATDFDVQGRGLGARLLAHVLDDFAGRGVRLLWANARVSAVDFYVATGWNVLDDSWHISTETGIEHVVISRPLV